MLTNAVNYLSCWNPIVKLIAYQMLHRELELNSLDNKWFSAYKSKSWCLIKKGMYWGKKKKKIMCFNSSPERFTKHLVGAKGVHQDFHGMQKKKKKKMLCRWKVFIFIKICDQIGKKYQFTLFIYLLLINCLVRTAVILIKLLIQIHPLYLGKRTD